MDFGAASSAFAFFTLTAAQAVVSLYVLSYTSHAFLVALEGTAAGNDEVPWPDEPFLDWLWKFWYLAWVVAMAVVPTWAVVQLFHLPPLQDALLLAGIASLIFPVLLLSSLSANSRWVLFRPLVLGRLLLRLGSLLTYYAASAALLTGCGALVYLAILRDLPLVVPAAALALACTVLIHARLLGRLAWLLSRMGVTEEEEEEKKPPAVEGVKAIDPWSVPDEEPGRVASKPRARGPRPPVQVQDPWAVPEGAPEPEVKPDRYLTREIYEVQTHAPAPPAAAPPPKPGDGYEVLPAPEVPAKEPAVTDKKEEKDSPEEELARYERELAVKPPEPAPDYPMFSGVYAFPLYSTSLRPLAWMFFGFLLMGLILWGQLLFMPH